jgi:RNA polymerase sigma-70 factor (ECF subfamily)
MHSQSNIPKLLAVAAEGDRHAFGEFYEVFLNEIYRYILFRINEPDEAEDLTSKVFLEAWENLTGGRHQQNIKNIRAWIYQIARNKVTDYYRTRKHQEPIDDNPDKSLQGAWLESDVEDLFISQKLAEGVQKLKADYQEVIIMRFINQMSHAEVAAIMNITEGHVRVLQYRALQQMRGIMSEVNNE